MTQHQSLQDYRIEHDSIGDIAVPSKVLWGAQTQRSLKYFNIGTDLMPKELIYAYALIKEACAKANAINGRLSHEKKDLIIHICHELKDGKFYDMFPLHVWMTGSGTQFNMNVNEVIANRASQLKKRPLGSHQPLHPNDDVNMAQSTNDTFPTSMHIATVITASKNLLPALEKIMISFQKKIKEWETIIKVGRTHLQDAVPITLGQELTGYYGILKDRFNDIKQAINNLLILPLGGTALGTGVNTEKDFDKRACAYIAQETGFAFKHSHNKFSLMGAHDALNAFSSSLKNLASSLFKIANDIRLLACGPRAGFNEILLPENEPGSSIMPGKINPTQAEALTMVCLQVISNDSAVNMGCANGMLDMNVYKPLIIHNILRSIRLLSDGMNNFRSFLIDGMKANKIKIKKDLEDSLIMATALSPAIGYEKAAKIAHAAHKNNMTLRQAAIESGYITETDYDQLVNPAKMLKPNI